MEASKHLLPRDIPCMDMSITVRYERDNIIDLLNMRGCCYHSYKSPLPNLCEDCAENATEERTNLLTIRTSSHASPKSTVLNGGSDLLNVESDAEKGIEGTCASLTLHARMDPMLASCLTTELRRSRTFQRSFRSSVLLLGLQTQVSCCSVRFQACKEAVNDFGPSLNKEDLLRIHLRIWLRRTPKCFRMEPDIKWSNRMLPQWIQRAQMEDAFSWLSTLGGAYSSLGENMYNCALEAGRVALRQLYLAECLGDAFLKSRCLLYIALSLMQRGQLTQAKKLVRQQYKFATSTSTCRDTRLVCMCQGIWHHLRHHYAKRKET